MVNAWLIFRGSPSKNDLTEERAGQLKGKVLTTENCSIPIDGFHLWFIWSLVLLVFFLNITNTHNITLVNFNLF